MKNIDVRFSHSDETTLRCMVGRRMNRYKHDPFVFSANVYGIVGICVEVGAWTFTNFIEVADYYGANEDVAFFRLQRANWDDIHSRIPDQTMIETPVGRVISSIDVVNERQKLFEKGIQTYEVCLTRGVVFKFDDGSELSFEKNIWFSEDITVRKGYNLIQSFSPTSEFIESWENNLRGECSREIVELRR